MTNVNEILEKKLQRRKIRNDYELGKTVLPYMQRFAEKLLPCPECGRTPGVVIVRDFNNEADVEIKMFCERMHTSKLLIDCGDWHKTLAKAGRSWNARVRGENNIDGKLHCTACGAKMDGKRKEVSK